MATLQRTPGRKVTRRLREPDRSLLRRPERQPSVAADNLTDKHNKAVAAYGSNSGGFHAFEPYSMASAGVFDQDGPFPDGTVVSDLSWGRIDPQFAQRLLEYDGVAR